MPEAKQLEQVLDGVAEAADDRLAVADQGVGRDALEAGHGSHDTGPWSFLVLLRSFVG